MVANQREQGSVAIPPVRDPRLSISKVRKCNARIFESSLEAIVHPLVQDLIVSFRSLRKSPQFTLVAVLTLTLGIAGNTLVFTLVNATLLRPLPYPRPHRLVILRWQDQSDVSAAAFFLMKDRARSFSVITALYPVNAGVNIAATGTPQYVKRCRFQRIFLRRSVFCRRLARPLMRNRTTSRATHGCPELRSLDTGVQS